MRGYDRDEDEYYDDYEDEGEEQMEEGEEEEEYEEEEERKPTAEELEYLELRARIKEQIRKKMQKENGSALSNTPEKKRKLPFDNFGSFFGPSKPVIASRVIQESKSLLENPHLAFRMSNSSNSNKKSSSNATGSKNGVREKIPKVKKELEMKVQKLKDTRDYSFLLSDDAEPPAPRKEPAPRNVRVPSSDARSAQIPQKSKQSIPMNGRYIPSSREERKPIVNGNVHSKAGTNKSASTSKPNPTSVDPRRQLVSNKKVGPGRAVGQKVLPSKTPVAPMEKKASATTARSILPAVHKPPPSKLPSSVPKQPLERRSLEQRSSEQRKGLQEPNKAKMVPRQPVTSSKPQVNKPVKQVPSHASLRDNHTKKKPIRHYSDDEDEKALSMIRRMFNTQRFANRDDDDSDMEANFDDIMREERRSAKIARKEDEEQLRLIEEEERRERMRKMAKKRKLTH